MALRRLSSPERNSSCLPFSYFFQNKNKAVKRDVFVTEIRYADEGQFDKYNKFISDYTEADLDYDKEIEDDETTLNDADTKPLDSSSRLQKLRKFMLKYNIGVYIIPSEDEHQSEITSPKDHRRQYISGFTGSAGVAIVTLNDAHNLTGEAALSTDGRYYLQAGQELDNNWELLKLTIPSYPSWQQWCINKSLENNFSKKISIDPKLMLYKDAEWLQTQCKNHDLQFEPIFTNLIDLVWEQTGEVPDYRNSIVYELELQFSGVTTDDKASQIRSLLQQDGCDSLVVTLLDDIAWLLNLRGDDVDCNPVFFSYVVVTMSEIWFYIEDCKIDTKAREYLNTVQNLKIKSYKSFWDEVSQLTNVMVPALPTLLLMNEIPRPKKFQSLVADLKTVKNATEIRGAKSAQFKDAIALARFFSWLEYQLIYKDRQIDEWALLQKSEYYRSVLPHYKGLSFETISSTGPNGAIIHYSPTLTKKDIIDPQNIYLCDSGAQYLDGTTDITRTLHFTKPTPEQIRNYTLVLKGHLALTMEVFLEGTSGSQLDILTRTPLWKYGLNYNHGTGHGIGAFLCVHENVYIGKNVPIKPNFFISDEPGYYKDGEYGIRLESDILCVNSEKPKFNEVGFLKFEYLTKVPFCLKLIDKKLLTEDEVKWVNDFNYQLRDELIPVLEQEFGDVRAIRWLLRETQPL